MPILLKGDEQRPELITAGVNGLSNHDNDFFLANPITSQEILLFPYNWKNIINCLKSYYKKN